MRVAILCDGRTLAEWQRRAVELIAGKHELYLLACDEPPVRRDIVRHAAYYALNLAAIRNRLTRRVPLPAVPVAGRLAVAPEVEGAWASLPQAAWDWIAGNRIDAIVKFGLGLLRVPDKAVPILSYHHGDPRSFRGRPAGYYELQQREPFMGQVVQILSNHLDRGEVLAFAQTRVVPHSYRETLVEAYSLSPRLLPQALDALEEGRRLPIEADGRHYRLPSNASVVGFAARRLGNLVRRIAYGGLIEKRWRVSLADIGDAADPCEAVRRAETVRERWQTPTLGRRHAFHADPIFHGSDGAFLVEAMNRRSAKGELLFIHDGEQRLVKGISGHASYPVSVEQAGERYLLPEISEWARQAIFRIEDGKAAKVAELDIDAAGLLDPTPYWHGHRLYLFANRTDEGPTILRLWSSDSLFGRFEEHPASPVRCSIRGSRMAGPVRRWPAGLIRTGQDYRGGYGDGILSFRIVELTPDHYREEEIGSAAFTDIKGPHTVDILDRRLLFDWYDEMFDPLAGVRRLLHRL